MAKNHMDKIAQILGIQLEKPFCIKGYGMNPCRLTKYHLINCEGCSISGHLVCLLTGEYEIEENSIFKKAEGTIQEFQLNEIVYTADFRRKQFVLDIGIVRNVEPLEIAARWNRYHEGEPYYGAPHLCHWIKSGRFSTPQEWEDVSMDKSTEYVCNHFGIQYER